VNPRNWTLRTRLIAVMVALVAATSIVIGGVMAIVVWQSYSKQFDASVQTAAQNFQRVVSGGAFENGPAQLGVDVGAIVAFYPDSVGTASGAYIAGGDTEHAQTLTAAQLEAIRSSSATADGHPGSCWTATVSGHGAYRFAAVRGPVPGAGLGIIVLGKPLAPLGRDVAEVLVPTAIVVLLTIVLAGVIGAFILRRALRPLRRVATVASNVAGMPLDRGDVHLAQRVPEEDTNPHTEVGQVGSALNSLLDSVSSALAVRQASEEKVRTFVADASHELRTPLASIRGYAELTRRFGGSLSPDVQHNISRIESESQRMTSLVEDLLLLARLDAERELDTADVDLSRLLVDVVSDAHAAGPQHEWDLELPDEPVVVRGDDAKLHQVFTNLLANARVHTPAGTRVTVQLEAPVGDSVSVLVRDSGPGIPAELQPRLFERFVRGDSSRTRSTGSTGLGLSIVSAVVAAHHGTVSVTSEPGATVFRVTLPVHQPAAPARSTALESVPS
jgi:two-component system, OmpR family, sensor kinase